MPKFLNKLILKGSLKKAPEGQVQKPKRKILSSIHRSWGLAARLQHPRIKSKKK